MKTTDIPGRLRTGSVKKTPRRGGLARSDLESVLFPARIDHKPIQWPTKRELRQVSTKLARVSRAGMRRETAGDYYNSGDFAYQLREIMRATVELFRKSQRLKS